MLRTPRVLAVLAITMASTFAGPIASARATAPSPAPLIAIDPGHGGRYSNANANGLREKNVNLAIAHELRRTLIARGYRVIMTRYTDRTVRFSDTRTWAFSRSRRTWSYSFDGRRGYVGGIPRDDLQARVDHANRAGADLFISIHANAARSRSARGTETWASPRDYLGRRLARIVTREVVRTTGLKNRGSRRADFYVCRWSNMPAILVETAFITNRRDAALLKKPWFRARVAAGIATGVDKWMATSPYRRLYPRIWAPTPIELANTISRRHFPNGAPVAVVTPSAHAAGTPGVAALAMRLGGPLLYVGRSGPTSSTAEELARIGPQRLVLVGVEGSFETSSVIALAQSSGIATSAVDVISGPTASRVSASIAASMGVGATREIVVVDADDAGARLAVASVAAARRIPIVMVRRGAMDATSASWISANRAFITRSIVVGRASRSSALRSWGLPSAIVIDGPDSAYNVALLNARYFRSTASGATRPVIASIDTGDAYLAAATHAARVSQPLAPVKGRRLPAFTRMWITNRRAQIGGFEVVATGTTSNLTDRMLAKSDAF